VLGAGEPSAVCLGSATVASREEGDEGFLAVNQRWTDKIKWSCSPSICALRTVDRTSDGLD
jgi:hypothetical protein